MKKKKQSKDSQNTAELLQKLQAAVLSSHKREKKEEPLDSDELEFQKKIAGMLGKVTPSTEPSEQAPAKKKGVSAKKQKAAEAPTSLPEDALEAEPEATEALEKAPDEITEAIAEAIAEAALEAKEITAPKRSTRPKKEKKKKTADREPIAPEKPHKGKIAPPLDEPPHTEEAEAPAEAAAAEETADATLPEQAEESAADRLETSSATPQAIQALTSDTEDTEKSAPPAEIAPAKTPQSTAHKKAPKEHKAPDSLQILTEEACADRQQKAPEPPKPQATEAPQAAPEQAAQSAPEKTVPPEQVLHRAPAQAPEKPVAPARVEKVEKPVTSVPAEKPEKQPAPVHAENTEAPIAPMRTEHAEKPDQNEPKQPDRVAPQISATPTKKYVKSVTPVYSPTQPRSEALAHENTLSPRVRMMRAEIKPRDSAADARAPVPARADTLEQKEIMQKKKDNATPESAAAKKQASPAAEKATREEPIVVRPKTSELAAEPIVIKPRQERSAAEPPKPAPQAAEQAPKRITPNTKATEAIQPEKKQAAPTSAPATQKPTAQKEQRSAQPRKAAVEDKKQPPRTDIPSEKPLEKPMEKKRTTVAPALPKSPKRKPAHTRQALPKENAIDSHLEEALDEVMPTDIPQIEEIPLESPPAEPLEAAAAPEKKTLFSRRREKKRKAEDSKASAASIIEKKTGMTEDDIAMIFELGYENELGHLVGYETLKKLKFEHIRKHRSDKRLYRTSFGYRGTEYTGSQSKESVLAAYAHDKRLLLVRLVLSVFFSLVMLPLDIPSLFGELLLPATEAYPSLFPVLAWLLLAVMSALHYRTLLAGLRSLLRFAPTPYSLNAVLLPLALIYGVAAICFDAVRGSTLTPICLPAALSLVLSDVCDALRLLGELRSFRILSAQGEKTVLDDAEPRKKKLRQGDKIVKILNDDIDQNLYRVRQSAEVSGFFRRFNHFAAANRPFTVMILLTLSLAFLGGLAGAIRMGTAAGALSFFATTLLFALPSASVLLFFYPLTLANRCLSRRNCTLVGEESVSEYGEAKTVIFNDDDMFVAEKCTQLSVREGEDFRRDMRLCGILFRKMSGTLASVGQPSKSADPSVTIVRLNEHGTEALVDNHYHILAGDAEFMTRSGVRVPRESSDRTLQRSRNVSLMYVAIGGSLRLAYEIEYKVYRDFEELVYLLASADVTTAIQTYDPNLNDAFLLSSRHDGAEYVRVIKPGRYEQETVLEVSDTGAVALGNKFDIALPLVASASVRSIRRTGLRLQVLLSLLSAVSACGICLAVGTPLLGAPALLPILWNALCLAAAAIYTRIKLKRDLE